MWRSSELRWSAVLGFALGGFFDGILLHQILQWHHLLSMVPGSGDLRMQVLWDGYFHLLMYAVAAMALFGLWRAHRREIGEPGRRLTGAVLIGFGLWHVVDALLSHWLLGIHRIRVETATPLFWDLLWFAVFGLLPMAMGWTLGRGIGPGPGRRQHAGALVLVTLLTGALGAWALQPPPDQPFTTIVFRSDMTAGEIGTSLAALDARLVWLDGSMSVVVADLPAANRWAAYRYGAILVDSTGFPPGCFAWTRT